ncbi:MAG: transporter, partial [Pseudomonadota bacterium]
MSAAPSRGRRSAVLLIWLALVLAGVAVISRTQFSADLSAFLPASPDARQRVLIEQLQSGVASRTLMIGLESGRDAAQRADVSRALGKAMRASGLFEQVQNGDHSDLQEAGTFVFDHRYQLSPDVSPARFTVDGLRDAIDDTLSMLGTPAGNIVKPLLERDPTGETQRIAEGMIPATSPRTEEGVWVSRSQPRALLLATTRASGSDIDAQSAAVARIETEYEHATRSLGAAAPRLLLSGAPVFSVQSRDQI